MGNLFTNRQETGFPSLPLLSLTSKEGIIPQKDSNRKNNSSGNKSRYLRVCPGDIAYNTMRMWEGRSAFVGLDGIVSPAYTVCKPNDEVDGLFFSYYFKTQQLIIQFRRYSQGLVKDTLSLKFPAFSKISVLTPALPEQQKIAEFLSSLDDLIAAHSQKLDALKAHKKGLLQQLFPAEGETVPRLRFPEFRDAGDWEVKRLGEVGNIFLNGGTPSTQKSEFWQGEIPWITGADVVNQKITEIRRFITEDAVKNSSTNIVEKGNLLIVTRTGVGKVAIAPFDLAISQDLTGVYINREQSTPEYLYRFYDYSSDKLKNLNQGTSIAGITRKSLMGMKVSLPSLPEQQRIADCLTALDDLIAAQSQKLDALKSHKKGLLQQLFPINNL